MKEKGLLIQKLQLGQFEHEDSQINKEFEERLNLFVKAYLNSSQYKDLDSRCNVKIEPSAKSSQASLFEQWWIILKRSFMNEIRNSLEVKLKFLESVIYGIGTIIVFEGLGDGGIGMQDR